MSQSLSPTTRLIMLAMVQLLSNDVTLLQAVDNGNPEVREKFYRTQDMIQKILKELNK